MRVFNRVPGWLATAIALTGLALSSPTNAQYLVGGTFPANATMSFDEMHALVASYFIDPRSAQYKELSVHEQPGIGQVICGFVNAKNAVGGYGDFYPFYVVVTTRLASIATDFWAGDESLTAFHTVGCDEPLVETIEPASTEYRREDFMPQCKSECAAAGSPPGYC